MNQRSRLFARVFELASARVGPLSVLALVSLSCTVGCTDVSSTGPTQQPTVQASKASLPPPIQTGPAAETVPVNLPPADPVVGSVPAAEQNAPPEPVESSEPAKTRKVLGKTTRDVRDAEKEEAKGATRVQPRITGQDPISISGSAYAAMVGRIEQLQIEDALNKFKALNDRYPKDYPEFKREIISANRIRLAQLPAYQEYGYDAVNHKLVILEYPDKKAQLLGK